MDATSTSAAILRQPPRPRQPRGQPRGQGRDHGHVGHALPPATSSSPSPRLSVDPVEPVEPVEGSRPAAASAAASAAAPAAPAASAVQPTQPVPPTQQAQAQAQAQQAPSDKGQGDKRDRFALPRNAVVRAELQAYVDTHHDGDMQAAARYLLIQGLMAVSPGAREAILAHQARAGATP